MCWIIPLIVGLISAIIGYLLGKQSNNIEERQSLQEKLAAATEEKTNLIEQLKQCQQQQTKHVQEVANFSSIEQKNQTDLNLLNEQHSELLQRYNSLKNKLNKESDQSNNRHNDLASIQPFAHRTNENIEKNKEITSFDADAAKNIFGKKVKLNDLTIVEGIGPKIAALFHAENINSWNDLANTSVEHCQHILNNAGERFTMHNPGTWPRQAKLADSNEWQALFDWQEELDGGKE